MPSNVIVDHPLFLTLGDAKEWALAYQALFSHKIYDDDALKLIRSEANRSGVLGGERFKDEIEARALNFVISRSDSDEKSLRLHIVKDFSLRSK